MGKSIIIKGADFSENALYLTPVISITNNGVVTISASCALSIYYTTDGTTPTVSSQEYSAPFTVTGGTTVKAIAAYASGMSSVSSETYSIAIYNVAQQLEQAILKIGYTLSASTRDLVATSSQVGNARATVLIPIAYEVIEAPLRTNTLSGQNTCIGIPDGINRITLRMTDNGYYYGLSLFDGSTYYDSGYIQGGDESSVSYEPDTIFSGNCWLACTMKKGSAGTAKFTDETLSSLGWECIVE